MKIFYNKYHVGFPIHIYSFEIIMDKAEFVFYNVDLKKIKEIIITFGDENITLKVDSADEVVKCKLDISKVGNDSFKPAVYSCVVEDKEYLASDFSDTFTVSNPDSVYSLGFERYLYTNILSRALKSPRNEIKYIAKRNQHFWTCTCGNYNLDSFDECKSCGKNQSTLFSVKVPVELEADKTIINIKLYKSTMIWLFLVIFIQLAYQSFYGTFLFENQSINTFFPVFNRFIIPSVLLLSNVAIVFSIMYYKKTLKLVSFIIFYGILAYINILSIVAFTNTAYMLLILIGLNLMALGIFRFNFRYQRRNTQSVVMLVLVFLSSIFMTYQWSNYTENDLIINPNGGVRINVVTDAEEYIIPDRLNNIDVTEVYFSLHNDYQITDLTIGKNVENIYMYSTAVLLHLENVYVHPENSNFYVEDNILYTSDQQIYLVPISITSLTVNTDTIRAGEFRDLYYLEELIIGPNVRIISHDAFSNNISLQSVTFDNNSIVEFIGEGAFYNCQRLESISLPESLTGLGVGVFENCNNLTYLRTPFIGEEREVTYILSESSDVLTYMFGSRTYLESNLIPNALETLIIYDIDRIHNVTFYNANYIKNIILPDTLLSLGIRSFYGCESLETFIIPDDVTIIRESAFEKSGIVTITIPDSVVYIDNNAFKDCDDLVNVIYEGNINDLVISNVGNNIIIDILNAS
ncbi:MAG: leucine-rich repeat protein [Tenericutes bacterium]|nr:leucine-rich repeat protein [Mycoplasmatota bacterium]